MTRLTEIQELRIESQARDLKKSMPIAYILNIFLGFMGAHRIYLGKHETGFAMAALLAIIMMLAVLGFRRDDLSYLNYANYLSYALGFWQFIDLFFIPKMLRNYNSELLDSLKADQLIKNEQAQ